MAGGALGSASEGGVITSGMTASLRVWIPTLKCLNWRESSVCTGANAGHQRLADRKSVTRTHAAGLVSRRPCPRCVMLNGRAGPRRSTWRGEIAPLDLFGREDAANATQARVELSRNGEPSTRSWRKAGGASSSSSGAQPTLRPVGVECGDPRGGETRAARRAIFGGVACERLVRASTQSAASIVALRQT